jgi:hypothetical protein
MCLIGVGPEQSGKRRTPVGLGRHGEIEREGEYLANGEVASDAIMQDPRHP